MTLVCNLQKLTGSSVQKPPIQLRICHALGFASATHTAAPSTVNTRNELII